MPTLVNVYVRSPDFDTTYDVELDADASADRVLEAVSSAMGVPVEGIEVELEGVPVERDAEVSSVGICEGDTLVVRLSEQYIAQRELQSLGYGNSIEELFRMMQSTTDAATMACTASWMIFTNPRLVVEDHRSRTALHAAASLGAHAVTSLLLEHGAIPNRIDDDGRYPLHIAAQNGFLPVVQQLLQHRAYCDVKNKTCHTPLCYAAEAGHLDVAMLLVAYGADPNVRASKDKRTPVHLAAYGGHEQHCWSTAAGTTLKTTQTARRCTMLRILAWLRCCWDTTLTPTYMHVMAAAMVGDTVLINMLRCGGSFNSRVKEQERPLKYIEPLPFVPRGLCLVGYTVLHIAVGTVGIRRVAYLLDHGGDPNTVADNGDTPLHVALQSGSANMAKFLISRGASPVAKNCRNMTPLDVAAYNGVAEVVAMLLAMGGLPNEPGLDGRTPLHRACERGEEASVRALLAGGGLVDVFDATCRTAVHWAAVSGSTGTMRAVLEHGADASAVDGEGCTPLEHAAGLGHDEVVALLQLHGGASTIDDDWEPLC
eukprot:TRINITY_DN572_c0_g1_i15.p1 TRINITY_DN572_c0_g1~~TRINITY_DN572_c0_g1_i15.p1  ORF type:complete len:541 (+),score=120.02 TRINITY_DN572_c0_g1_i15:39-1661(+)